MKGYKKPVVFLHKEYESLIQASNSTGYSPYVIKTICDDPKTKMGWYK